MQYRIFYSYAEYRYAECQNFVIIMLGIAMFIFTVMRVAMLSVTMMDVVVMNVVAPTC
jgi:hypothetical protein